MRWMVVVMLAGCSGTPCEPRRLPDCDGCGPGEIRHGLSFSDVQSLASVVTFDDGTIACTACSQVLYRDARGDARTTLDLDIARSGFFVVVRAVAAGDALYAVREETEQDEPEPITYDHFLALDEQGRTRWKIDPLPAGVRVVAAAAAGPFLQDATTLTAYAAADGSVRWTAPAAEIVTGDAAGGAFVVVASPQPIAPTMTLAALDANGAARWTKTLTASGGMNLPPGVAIDSIAASPDGGLLVTAGFVAATLDLGQITLPAPTGQDGAELVAKLAADGTTLWAHVLPPELMSPTVLPLGDTALVVDALAGDGDGTALGLPTADATDSVIAIYDANGLVRADLFGGPGQQVIESAAPARDGSVWVHITADRGVTVGSQSFGPYGLALDLVP